ncbi:signal peptidase I [Zobellia galactanivorans]|uniref:signal peptidase I n=1 Tax=Zobellia TaxID=112040 RepID=UPI000B52D2CF|nr:MULTISPECIES: signal peptidase I [Zobellia]MBU3024357.1 signal peptidase I [Zobellia galactanivorans]MDO6807464.1 signal peptidase I [Zobellia galactanivorans]OWW24174.1 signal peptidase I [Zobellia sp. OII3]
MDAIQWLLFILIVQIIHFAGTWKLYVKAGRKAWEAAIPVYNAIVLMQIINRPKWWTVLLFIPIINLLMFPIVWIETIRSFGRNSTADTWLVILTLGFYIYYVNYALDVKYIENRNLHPQTATGEWVSSIAFAIIAATLVHTYFIQPYVIPTPSLERTLRVGDLLFVSKFHYGARTPMTTVAAPMVHDTLPLLHVKSYLDKPQLPYFRIPGFTKVDRNDIVVFSWPADTVRQFFKKEKGVRKPIDKKSNYVKRCVGIPGDSLAVIDGYVYINGKQLQLSDRAKPQYDYALYSSKGVSSKLLEKVDATGYDRKYIINSLNQQQLNAIQKYVRGYRQRNDGKLEVYTKYTGIPQSVARKNAISMVEETALKRIVPLTDEMVEVLKKEPSLDSIVRIVEAKGVAGGNIFPQSPDYPWNYDQMGPIYIPEKGATVSLNLKTLPLYKKIIRDYEGNSLSVSGNQIIINGQATDKYTFKQDYYWMMGDNRDHSEDSRAWGYVPENHIVGTPIFIWLSVDNFNDGILNWKPRWDRIFTTVNGEGEPVSYFKYFLIALVAYFVGSWLWNKKKAKA